MALPTSTLAHINKVTLQSHYTILCLHNGPLTTRNADLAVDQSFKFMNFRTKNIYVYIFQLYEFTSLVVITHLVITS
jgi:hypothetical protein